MKLDEAEALIKKALELNPGNGFITDSLGWLYFKKGTNSRWQKYLKEAVGLVPGDPVIVEHLGDVYEKMGAFKEALTTYERALQMNPASEALQENRTTPEETLNQELQPKCHFFPEHQAPGLLHILSGKLKERIP